MSDHIRDSIALLSDDWAFTQCSLLSRAQFKNACKERGAGALSHALEELHRAGILVPVFRVRQDVGAARRYAQENDVPLSNVLNRESFEIDVLRDAHVYGRLHDPGEELYHSPSRYRRRSDGEFIATSIFAYSPYQLLQLPKLSNLELSRSPRDGKLKATVPKTAFGFRMASEAGRRNRELTVALSALESVYRPEIVDRLSLTWEREWEDWCKYRESFDPAQMLKELSWTTEEVQETARGLLGAADSIDPLGDWNEVVRMGPPRKWDKLRLGALLAMDHRIAAEILLLFYEDLCALGSAPPLPDIPPLVRDPLYNRLKVDRGTLERVLMDFGLSPYPLVVLIVEGETEMLVVPRVMELLGVRQGVGAVKLVNAGGANKDLQLIAAYAVAPEVIVQIKNSEDEQNENYGDQQHQYDVDLTRPPVRFVVAMDPEEKFETRGDRDRQQQIWTDRILRDLLPSTVKSFPDRQKDVQKVVMRAHIAELVEVHTWNDKDESFEFANWTDKELASALTALCKRHGTDHVVTSDCVANRRFQPRKKDRILDPLWKKIMKCSQDVPKLELAEELWPALERKIRDAIAVGDDHDIPVARLVWHVRDLVDHTPRINVRLRQ